MRMVMSLRLMEWMVMLMRFVLSRMIMVVRFRGSAMGVLMAVLVKVLMSVHVRVLMRMFLAFVRVFMGMGMLVLMSVEMFVFVFTFHECSSILKLGCPFIELLS